MLLGYSAGESETSSIDASIDRVPSYPNFPSPFIVHPNLLNTFDTSPGTPPPRYDNWFNDGIFKNAISKN